MAVLPPSLCLVLELAAPGLYGCALRTPRPQRYERTAWFGLGKVFFVSFSIFDSSVRPGPLEDPAARLQDDGRAVNPRYEEGDASEERVGADPGHGLGADCTVGNRDSYAFELDSTYLRRIDVALNAAKGVAAVHELLGVVGAHNDIKSPNFYVMNLTRRGLQADRG